MGHLRGPAAHVRRPEDHQARLQGHPAEQEDHRSQPGQAGHPGQEDIQGNQAASVMLKKTFDFRQLKFLQDFAAD